MNAGIRLVCAQCRKHTKLYLIPTRKDGYFCEDCLEEHLKGGK